MNKHLRNGKAVATNNGLVNPFDLLKKNQNLTNYDFRHYKTKMQCKNCRNDHLKHSVDGLCQDCLQRVEYVVRECSTISERYKLEGGKTR